MVLQCVCVCALLTQSKSFQTLNLNQYLLTEQSSQYRIEWDESTLKDCACIYAKKSDKQPVLPLSMGTQCFDTSLQGAIV